FDDTHSPFEENVANSIEYRKFVEASGRKKVMEGCLEEVAAAGAGKDTDESPATDPNDIEAYLERTGFELVVPNIGTESIHARQVGVQWGGLEQLHERGVGPRLIIHGFSSVRKLPTDQQRRLGELGCVGMNAWSYIPQAIGPQLLERSAALLGAKHDEKGFPLSFDDSGNPVYDATGDANSFFTPVLDHVRDLKTSLIADSVYEILGNLGFAKLGSS
ncbi:MAG: class II fructose-bisphosphate aldolase, partial [Planctomycetota bacterium]